MKKNCLNCIHPRNLGDRISCRAEPGVCDHAFVISIKEAENYCCEEYMHKDARNKFNEECDENCIVHKLITRHPTTLSVQAVKVAPILWICKCSLMLCLFTSRKKGSNVK